MTQYNSGAPVIIYGESLGGAVGIYAAVTSKHSKNFGRKSYPCKVFVLASLGLTLSFQAVLCCKTPLPPSLTWWIRHTPPPIAVTTTAKPTVLHHPLLLIPPLSSFAQCAISSALSSTTFGAAHRCCCCFFFDVLCVHVSSTIHSYMLLSPPSLTLFSHFLCAQLLPRVSCPVLFFSR